MTFLTMTQILGGWGDKVQPHKDIKVRISALFGGFLCKPGLSSPTMLSMTTVSPNVSIMSIMLIKPQGLFMLPLPGCMVPPRCSSTSSLLRTPCGCKGLLEKLNYEGKFQISSFPEPAVLISEKHVIETPVHQCLLQHYSN